MKKFLLILALLTGSLAHSLPAQPASIGNRVDTLVSTTDTILLQARQTNIVADITVGSITITIDSPDEAYAGFNVTIVQLNAASGRLVTMATLSGFTNEFQSSNSLTSTHAFTADVYQVTTFTCLKVAAATYKWVKIN